jgi:hypothetical protein
MPCAPQFTTVTPLNTIISDELLTCNSDNSDKSRVSEKNLYCATNRTQNDGAPDEFGRSWSTSVIRDRRASAWRRLHAVALLRSAGQEVRAGREASGRAPEAGASRCRGHRCHRHNSGSTDHVRTSRRDRTADGRSETRPAPGPCPANEGFPGCGSSPCDPVATCPNLPTDAGSPFQPCERPTTVSGRGRGVPATYLLGPVPAHALTRVKRCTGGGNIAETFVIRGPCRPGDGHLPRVWRRRTGARESLAGRSPRGQS